MRCNWEKVGIYIWIWQEWEKLVNAELTRVYVNTYRLDNA